MKANEVAKAIRKAGGSEIRKGKGSHVIYACGKCGTCRAALPTYHGDIALGTLRGIEKKLEKCLGKGWLLG